MYDDDQTSIVQFQQAENFQREAINCLKQASEIVKIHFPEDSPHSIKIRAKLKNLE